MERARRARQTPSGCGQALALRDARLERLRLANTALAEKLKVVRAELARACEHAYHDPLTGLPNRTLLLDRLHQAITHCARKGRQCAPLFLDLDDFKAVNDNYGHQAGDEVLPRLPFPQATWSAPRWRR